MPADAHVQPAPNLVERANLEVSGLRVDLGATGVDIVDEISFSVGRGAVTGLVGESGSGKTTVALALLGATRPGARIVRGKVLVTGSDVLAMSAAQLRATRGALISYLPQDPAAALNPSLRIEAQIHEALSAHDFGGSAQARCERMAAVLQDVELPGDRGMLRRFPHQLSGGQQQRAALAMAFACRPSVIVMDEPTTGLDVSTQAHILQTVRQLSSDYAVSTLYVSHDLAVVSEIADDVLSCPAVARRPGPRPRRPGRPGTPTRSLCAGRCPRWSSAAGSMESPVRRRCRERAQPGAGSPTGAPSPRRSAGPPSRRWCR